MDAEREDRIEALMMTGLREGVYPGAVLLVAKGGDILFFHKAGHSSFIPDRTPMHKDTIFDLASLSKPLATTLAIMKLVDEGTIHLDQTIMSLLKKVLPSDKRTLTPRLLLSHSAGLIDWKPYYLELVKYRTEERKRVVREWLLEAPLVYHPGQNCLYSDLGFIILEWLVEETAGMSMAVFLERHFYRPLSLKDTFLCSEASLPRFKKEAFAATEACPWRREIIQGQVHDENAFALGGYSGHAGLFGTAEEVYKIVNLLREHYMGVRDDFLGPETVREFFAKQENTTACTWALGWDTPSLENSSSGRYFSSKSVGHLGFTGTSIWMDLEKDAIAILLSNRIHPTRRNEKIKAFRPLLHDVVMEELMHS